MTKVFSEGEQVKVHPGASTQKPGMSSKDVTGLLGRVTGINKAMEHESLWIYEVTFDQYKQVQVLDPDTTPGTINEQVTIRCTADELEPVEREEE